MNKSSEGVGNCKLRGISLVSFSGARFAFYSPPREIVYTNVLLQKWVHNPEDHHRGFSVSLPYYPQIRVFVTACRVVSRQIPIRKLKEGVVDGESETIRSGAESFGILAVVNGCLRSWYANGVVVPRLQGVGIRQVVNQTS